MKGLIRNLFYAKIGAGVISTVIANRKKNQALKEIEHSPFFELFQRITYHPRSTRADGFYQIVYTFMHTFQDKTEVEAIVRNFRPVDRLTVKDSVDITIRSGEKTLHVSQKIGRRPLITTPYVPGFIKENVLGILWLESENSEEEIREAFHTTLKALESLD